MHNLQTPSVVADETRHHYVNLFEIFRDCLDQALETKDWRIVQEVQLGMSATIRVNSTKEESDG